MRFGNIAELTARSKRDAKTVRRAAFRFKMAV